MKVGNSPVIVTSHDSAWYAAFDISDAGGRVTAIVDTRADVASHLLKEASARSIEVLQSHTVTGSRGRKRVSAIRVNAVQTGRVGGARWIGCDAVLMCGGWTPSLHLFSHTQGKLDWDANAGVFLPGKKTENCEIAGAGRGLWGIAAVLQDGAKAGATVVDYTWKNRQNGELCRFK